MVYRYLRRQRTQITTGNVDIAWFEGDGNVEKKITDKYTGIQFGTETPVTPGQNLDKEARIKNEGKNAHIFELRLYFLRVRMKYASLSIWI